MKLKHTPGPWKQDYPNSIISLDGKQIAITYNSSRDARFIAAAPELLNELRLYVITCACGSHQSGEINFNNTCHRCASAVRAIQKATS